MVAWYSYEAERYILYVYLMEHADGKVVSKLSDFHLKIPHYVLKINFQMNIFHIVNGKSEDKIRLNHLPKVKP